MAEITERVFGVFQSTGSFLSPCRPCHMQCGSGNSPSWNMEACPYTQRSPQLEQHDNILVKETELLFNRINKININKIFNSLV